MLFAVNSDGQDIFINDDPYFLRQKLYCPECGCEVTPAALHSLKVRAYFRAVSAHKEGCVFQARIVTPEQEAARNRLDIARVWSRMFRSDGKVNDFSKQQSKGSREKNPLSHPSVHTALDQDYFHKAILVLYQLCLKKKVTDYIGDDMVKDIFCGHKTAFIYRSYISGKVLVECSFLSYDRDKRVIYYRFPAGSENGLIIRAKFWYEDDLKQAISDAFSHDGVILLFSMFYTPGKYVQTDIKTLNQVVYA